jgi:phage FluMu gp28-like protein
LINQCCTLTFQGAHQRRWTKTHRTSKNPIQIGWDFARSFDISACEVFEEMDGVWVHIYELLLRGSDTPSQNRALDSLVESFRPDMIRIDMTGNGTGLYDYAREKHKRLVEGVHFSRKKHIRYQRGESVKDTLKNLMAQNLRNAMQDGEIQFFDYLALKHDLHSVPFDLRDPQRTEEGSHGDRFWATALAIYPARRRGGEMTISFGRRPR